MDRTERQTQRRADAGITMIETLLASAILAIGALGMLGLIVGSIATNNRNKLDSTQTMLATSIVEQIDSTIIGTGTSTLIDCGAVSHTIQTQLGGANLSGEKIDFTQAVSGVPSGYQMDYVLRTPCSGSGVLQGTYDVRWHVDIIGSVTDTKTYMLTIGAKLKNRGQGNLFFSLPVTVRVMSGN